MTMTRDKIEELTALLREIRPNYGDVGTRDVDVARQQKQIDRAVELLDLAQRAMVPQPQEGQAQCPHDDKPACAECQGIGMCYATGEHLAASQQPQGQALPELPDAPLLGVGQDGLDIYGFTANQVQEYARAYASQLALPAGTVPEELLAVAAEHAAHAMQKKCFDAGSEARICAIHFPPIIKAAVDAALASPSPAVAQPVAGEMYKALATVRTCDLSDLPGDAVAMIDAALQARAALCPPAEEGGKS